MCSCYVPSRNYFNNSRQSKNSKRDHGVMEQVCNNNEAYPQQQQGEEKGNGIERSSDCNTTTLKKSNLKKTTTVEENQTNAEKRKVSWPDHALGKDIAHIHEFQPSMFEDGEFEGVRNCACTIQ